MSMLLKLALVTVVLSLGIMVGPVAVHGQDAPASLSGVPSDYSCSMCHSKDGELWNEMIPVATADHLADDVHWQKGLRCHDCHGGSPTADEFKNHRNDPTFRSIASRAAIPGFCGHCHSNIDYMRQYAPSARTDQESEYWTSGHGIRLKASSESGDPAQLDKLVPTCVDCHKGHGILAVKNPNAGVYPTHVAETCGRCHADQQRMAGRMIHDRPIGTRQLDEWRQGVHGHALTVKGDLSAPTCNDCHGNHGARPPGVNSVANACGSCHGKVAKLFAETSMRHQFEKSGLPGCATCHGAHLTIQPSDDMLGMQDHAVCFGCHNPQNPKYGAAVAGAKAARDIRAGLDRLKQEIDLAENRVREAERLGMEVRGPRFDLRQAFDALTNARTQVHTFKPGPVEEALQVGLRVTASVQEKADEALREHHRRRVWLATSLVPILLVVGLLLLYIRSVGPVAEVESRGSE